jgi:UPF0755 protein
VSDERDHRELHGDPYADPPPDQDFAMFGEEPADPAHDEYVGVDEGYAEEPYDAEGYRDDDPVRRENGLKSCLAVVVVVAVLLAGGAWLLSKGVGELQDMFAGPEDYSGDGTGSVVFEVREGDSSSVIGRNLEDAGVVASAEAFTDAAAEEPDSRGIQVGFYELKEEMSAEAALEVLVDPDNLVTNTVTIPEGLRVEDTLARIAKATDVPLKQLERASKDAEAIGLPSYAKGNPEGYLFPATYAFGPNAGATDMLAAMVERWRQAADEAQLEERADELGYDPGELMTIASLVEAEANRDEDRGKVARVIYNRLESDATNGLLQIDATVNYALGRDLGLGLTSEQLDVDSPYNTRRYPGLPPGPIESPGDAAIEAAANPPEGDWIYYVTVNLDTGETKFTEDYDEFLRLKNEELAEFCDGSDRC